MGKFMLYGVIVFIIAFAANFFGFVSIPWLDVPFATEKSYYTRGTERRNEAAREALGEK